MTVEHLELFGLSKDPFEVEPDLDFYVEKGARSSLRARVQRGLIQAKGLTLLTGDDGTGKTLLARRILYDLDSERFESVWMVLLPGTLGGGTILQRFARELGVDGPSTERGALVSEIHSALHSIRSEGRHAVLILDDAQLLDRRSLAAVGSLLALESDERRLLSMLLVGPPALLQSVRDDPVLGTRVDVRCRLEALGTDEISSYIDRRWECAGGAAGAIPASFAPRVFALTGGRLRRVNTLMDNALFEAYLAGRSHLEAEDIENASRGLGFESGEGLSKARFSSAASAAPGLTSVPSGLATAPLDRAGSIGDAGSSALRLEGGSSDLSPGGSGVEMLLGEEDVLELGEPMSEFSVGGFED